MSTAICRWLARKGVRVAPFKAQNMSNNSFPCPDGGEIGRAQVAQAEACYLAPSVDMNPILLKPTGEMGSQVIIQGLAWKNLKAREYYEHHEFLSEKVMESYERLAKQFDFVVIEGAGSIAEINLRKTDLSNFGLATKLGCPVLLVADIDRGGVFGSILGTLALLSPDELDLVKGFAVNKFRGDPALFADGAKMLESRTGKPCMGVFPYANEIYLDAEDSVTIEQSCPRPAGAPNIAIVRFPRISNTTDFRRLPWANWIERPPHEAFDVIILPGSKNTIADLRWLRSQGLESWIRGQHSAGATIVGICGGYQMLGDQIEDPMGIESNVASEVGLGLVPCDTRLASNKTITCVTARSPRGLAFQAYEIHHGVTTLLIDAPPFCFIEGRPEGIMYNGCIGTYLHGAFENEGLIEECLGFRVAGGTKKNAGYDLLADWFESAVNPELFKEWYVPKP